jgi:glycosyltransferase involved in cell wall biosynthesis
MTQSPTSSFGINIFGSFAHSNGLSYTGQNIARTLIANGVKVSLLNYFMDGDKADQIPDDLKPYVEESLERLDQPINLYVLGIEQLRILMRDTPQIYLNTNRMHVADFWWEFTEISEIDRAELMKFDVLLTHSQFVAEIARNGVHFTHHINTTQPAPTLTAQANKAKFGFSETATTFIFAFNIFSNVLRKNPQAVIAAFKLAFEQGDEDVQLLIKISHFEEQRHRFILDQLKAAIGDDHRITLHTEKLSYDEILSLYASADVYVSLHRSEGFGLGMLESMALGKPVIATAWSGNRDFMNMANACMVRTTGLVGFPEDYQYAGVPFPAGARVANPVIQDAAAYMRRLHSDPTYRRLKAEQAYAGFLVYQKKASDVHWIDELKECWQSAQYMPAVFSKYSVKIMDQS